ncbi:MAG: hypothetical protein ABGY42_06915 [bacterium]
MCSDRDARLDFLQVDDDLVEHPAVDGFAPERVADEERIVADCIDQAWDAIGILPDRVVCLWQEEGAVATGDGESRLVEERKLVARERIETAAHRNTLLELADARVGEAVGEFGLTAEHDLEDLVLRCLEIGEQTQGF